MLLPDMRNMRARAERERGAGAAAFNGSVSCRGRLHLVERAVPVLRFPNVETNMKKAVAAILAVAAPASLLLAQPSLVVLTRPGPMSPEVLGRMRLTEAWRTRLRLDGRRDCLASVQILPGQPQAQLLVRSRSGTVYLLNGETGDQVWTMSVGSPYWIGQPGAWNSRDIFVTQRDRLFVLNRRNGRQRLFRMDPDTKEKVNGYVLDFAPSTTPVADENFLYVPMNTRVLAYEMPNYDLLERASRFENVEESKRYPRVAWSLDTGLNILQPPVPANGQVGVVATDGTLLSLSRFESKIRFGFQAKAGVDVALGHYGLVSYMGAQDYNVYAVNMASGKVEWRFPAGGPIDRRPYVTDEDVYAFARGQGLYRLNRSAGTKEWLNPDAVQFLATNKRFTYALDRVQRLLVLDGRRGTTLAHFDLRDWRLPVPNETNDRIYLANHDGQIVCLHHRDEPTPLVLRSPPVEPMVK